MDLIDRAQLLESYIRDRFIGDWVANTYLIVGTAFFSWLVAYLGGGMAWLFVVLAFAATIYRNSFTRLERNLTDDLSRENAMKKLETDTESLEWLNSFLDKFWIIYEPVLSETVIGVANQVLSGATPPLVESLSLKEFTLGTKPPSITSVRSYPDTDPDVIVMDWRFAFTPNETEDMTARQLKDKKNPKVELSIRVGKGVVSKGLPVLVEDMAMKGLMRVRVKLIPSFPHAKTVDVSFLEPPSVEFALKPIGGDSFGFDINIIPGLESFIRSQIDANLGPMLYAPNAYQVNVEEMMAAAASNSAIGVLAITIFNASGLKGSESIGKSVDPYLTFSLDNITELARSDIKKATKNPRWNETKYILVSSLKDTLYINAFDFKDFKKDKNIGTTSISLENLAETPDQTGLSQELILNDKSSGTLEYELHWFPVLEGKALEDGTVEPPPDTNTGIVRFITHQCKDLDATKSLVGQLSPYSDLLMNGNLLHQSNSLKRTNNPVWTDTYEFMVTDKSKCDIGIRVKDSRGLATDPVIGTYQIKLDTLFDKLAQGTNWFKLTPSGSVKLEAIWKPIALKGSAATKNYAPPIGSLRIQVIKAGEEFRNLEAIGKVDPYIRMFLNGFQRGRTMAVPNTLTPAWNEVIYIPVKSSGQRLVVEAMDAENLGQDRSLGQFELDTGDFVQSNEDGEYLEFIDTKPRNSKFSLKGKSEKGSLLYTVSFFPSVNVLNPDIAAEQREEAEKKVKEAEKLAAEKVTDGSSEDKEKDEKDSSTLAEKSETDNAKDIPLQELIKNDCGIAAITFLDVNMSDKDLFVRVFVDEGVYPAFSTPRISNRIQALGETGELVIRELEWSKLIFQITSKVNKPKKDDIIASYKVDTMALLKRSYDQPYKLVIKNGNQTAGTLNVRMRYFPMLMQLDPSESVNNMGTLTGEIVKADNVPAADRSGYSDPYTNVTLNDKVIFKTKTIKKTLNPVWNEQFTTEILSRTRDSFILEVYDWDMGPGSDDFLGNVKIDLAQLEPLTPTSLTLPLQGKSGTITVNFLFKPSYVARKVDSAGIGATFANGAAIPGQIVGGAIGGAVGIAGTAGNVAGGVIGGVAGGVVGGAGKVGGFVGGGIKGGANKLFHRKDSLSSSGASDSNAGVGGEQQAQINISYATGFNGISTLQVKAYMIKDRKEKDLYKTKSVRYSENQFTFDETFNVTASPETPIMLKVRESRALGRSDEIGEVTIDLKEHATGHPVTLPVSDLGELTVLVEYADQ